MSITTDPRSRRLPRAAIALALSLGMVAAAAPAASASTTAAGRGVEAAAPLATDDVLPVFTSDGPIVDRFTDETWNPTNEFIFPSVFHAGEHLDDPLGEWYVYYAPHDAPGGINLMYADSLDGPWTQYTDNPLVENSWDDHYDVSHVSAPDAVWNEETDEVFLFFHGENTTDRVAASDDGVTFEYRGEVMSTQQFGRDATETSYNRVFPNPFPENGWEYAMFFMVNDTSNVRRIALAYSHDMLTWEAQPGWVVEPTAVEGTNVAGPELWEWEGTHYVLYGSSAGSIFARELGTDLRATGDPMPLYIPSPFPPEEGRTSSPQIVTDGDRTHMIFEIGGRSGTTIAHAVLDPDGRRDPVNRHPEDPMFELCAADGSDEFDGDALSADWDVLRDGDGRQRVEDGALVLTSPPTSIGEATIPLRAVPDGAWEVTTELEYAPTENYHQAGLALYRDDLNNAKLVWSFAKGGQRFDFTWKQNGKDRFDGWAWEDTLFPPADVGDTVWLRLSSNGEHIVAAASTDGQSFTTVGRPIPLADLAPTGVGATAFRGATGAADTEARFDWFRFSPTDEAYAECLDGSDPGTDPGDDDDVPPADWPDFGYQGIVTDKSTMDYNPANEFIFPSVFHAGEHFENPLGEWYLYTAPHNDPGGIVLMYADSLEGPWTEYTGNPVISRTWEPYYDLSTGRDGDSHVSTPDAFWNADEGKMFLYFHGNNSVTRYATSDDGVTFEYGGEAVTNAMSTVEGGPRIVQSAYARVFDHPDPESPYDYAMLYMTNDDTPVEGGLPGVRRIRLAESVDGRDWVVEPQVILSPGEEEGANVSSPNLWEHDGQLYLLYHASSGKSYARTIDKTLRHVGDEPILLHEASGLGNDVGRVAAPEIVEDGDDTYLFYEAGDRLGGTIAWAKDGAETVIDPPFGGFPIDPENPLFETCAAEGSDEFDDGLGDVWSRVVREDAARHQVVDGALTVPTYTGGVAAAPLLQQELPDGAWQITTKVHIDPSLNYQQAGLLLYASDTDYVKLDLGKAKPGRVVELVSAGPVSSTVQNRYEGVTDIWLRLTSDGAQIEGSASEDGVEFTRIGSLLGAESASGGPRFTHVGPFAFRGGEAVPEIEASFDWFRFSPGEEQYADCTGDDDDQGDDGDQGGDPGDGDQGDDGDDGNQGDDGDGPTASLSASTVHPGDRLTVTATGFAPGEDVSGVMHSDPLPLGTTTADAAGGASFTWTIPADTPAGVHTVVLTGASGAAEVAFRVVGAAAGDGGLATTGGGPGAWPFIGGALIVLGSAVVLIVRRRRTITD